MGARAQAICVAVVFVPTLLWFLRTSSPVVEAQGKPEYAGSSPRRRATQRPHIASLRLCTRVITPTTPLRLTNNASGNGRPRREVQRTVLAKEAGRQGKARMPGGSRNLPQLKDVHTVLHRTGAARRDLQDRDVLSIAAPARTLLSLARKLIKGRQPGGQGPRWAQVDALVSLKSRLIPAREDVLSSWIVPPGASSPSFLCSWHGVTCKRGDVVALKLANEGTTPLWARVRRENGTAVGKEQSIGADIAALTALTSLDLSNNAQIFDSAGGRQQNLFLGLSGPIPSEVGRLTGLRVLNLQGNSLFGPIPEQIGDLGQLEQLNLGYNALSGSLPPSICRLSRLTSLSLGYNNIAGSLPQCISSLSSLSDLSLSSLPLSGSIPSTIGMMTQLIIINILNLPSLSGPIPSSLSLLSNLQDLSITFTNISGTIPGADWWLQLKALSSLTLTSSPLSGPLPLGLPPSLSSLSLEHLPLSGSIPPSLISSVCNSSQSPALVGLTSLTIQACGQGGPIPASMSLCTGLVFLKLSDNRLAGGIQRNFFQALGQLQSFSVGSNLLREWGPPEDVIKQIPSIQIFNISLNGFEGLAPLLLCPSPPAPGVLPLVDFSIRGNRFTGDVGKVLGKYRFCDAYIDVSSNFLTGSLPRGWVRHVWGLNISRNNISGPLPPASTADCSNLLKLDTSFNSISGLIPKSSLNSCSKLVSLNLSRNNFSGSVPRVSSKDAGQTLQTINLAYNTLSGSIPDSLSKLANLRRIDLSRNNLSGPIPSLLSSLLNLQSLRLAHNQLNSSIPSELGLLFLLTSLSLAANSLTDQIPPSLAPPFLPSLSSLDLSRNQLHGAIPYGFQDPRTFSLRVDLSNNNLSGAVPGGDTGPLATQPQSVAGNPSLCAGAGYPECSLALASAAGGLSAGAVAGVVIGCLLVASLLGVMVVKWASGSGDEWEKGVLLSFHDFQPPLTIGQLLDGSDQFSQDNLLGQGGFGAVFKATLPGNLEVAVKKLLPSPTQSAEVNEEFEAEVQVLGKLAHKNIVRLLAAYVAAPPRKERLLVYEYLDGGTLDFVFKEAIPQESPLCKPEVRYRVMLDTARGLRYLHHHCHPAIIHRDVKPANVLLNADFVAQVADFGLAKLVDPDHDHDHTTETSVVGTAGFVAPEYALRKHLSVKSDVYSFGVTLIQVISGRRTTDDHILDKGLQRWASSGASIVDPRLETDSDEPLQRMIACLKIGMLCISRTPCDRPSMEEVVHLLEDCMNLEPSF